MSDTIDIRCPECKRLLMTLTYRKPLEVVIVTACKRCPARKNRVDITFPDPLTGSTVTPLVAMV